MLAENPVTVNAQVQGLPRETELSNPQEDPQCSMRKPGKGKKQVKANHGGVMKGVWMLSCCGCWRFPPWELSHGSHETCCLGWSLRESWAALRIPILSSTLFFTAPQWWEKKTETGKLGQIASKGSEEKEILKQTGLLDFEGTKYTG